MRSIIFRAKTIGLDDRRWVTGDLHLHSNAPHIHSGPFKHPIDVSTVGEFTGLKDKNGKEIYEGDIICIHDNDYDDDSNSEVKFRNGVFGVENWTKKSLTTLNFFMLDSNSYEPEYSVEVVGNIHDNPELIRKELKK